MAENRPVRFRAHPGNSNSLTTLIDKVFLLLFVHKKKILPTSQPIDFTTAFRRLLYAILLPAHSQHVRDRVGQIGSVQRVEMELVDAVGLQ